MSWRVVVIGHNAKLDYQLGYLVVRSQNVLRISLSEIGLLIIESTAVSLTSYLLNEMTKKKIKVIFCDEKRNPSSELLPYYGSFNTSLKIRKQIQWKETTKCAVWTEIVREKIQKQKEVLEKEGKEEASLLQSYMDQLQPGDATNREGHAAKVYFNAMFGTDFVRSEDNPINAALNYGYSILLSCFTREITANGYLTQLGLFHENMFNPFNLASDLMEPYRPLVDDLVYAVQPEKFSTEEKHQMLSLLGKEVEINQKKEVLGNSIKIYAKGVFDALENDDIQCMRLVLAYK